MPGVVRNTGSMSSLHTIPEESKALTANIDREYEKQLSNDSKTSSDRMHTQRSNSLFINAIRKTSTAILTLAHATSIPKDLNDEPRYSMQAVEAKRKNRRNGEWVFFSYLLIKYLHSLECERSRRALDLKDKRFEAWKSRNFEISGFWKPLESLDFSKNHKSLILKFKSKVLKNIRLWVRKNPDVKRGH